MIRALARAAVRNPVAANLLLCAVVLAGLLAYRAMPREVFPDFSLDTIEVFTVHPGAAPEDVERLVTAPIEDALRGLDGVDALRSLSRESTSRVFLSLLPGTDTARTLAEARDRIRGGDVTLPEGAEEPRIFEAQNRFPVIAVFVYGSADQEVLGEVADRVRRGLEDLPGVARVDVTGDLEPELSVDIDPAALERAGLSYHAVAAAVGARVRDLPLGAEPAPGGERLLRLVGGIERARDLADLPLRALPDGRVLRLAEVAELRDTFAEPVTRGRFNGFPAIHLQVLKTETGDTIDIAALVREYVAREAQEVPPGVALGTNSDLSVYVRNRLVTMAESAAYGAVLVLVALLLFLTPRVALATAVGIPVAFLGGIALAHALGVTMNMITMFALIVVLGMVVDDAIVVAENVFRRIEEGEDPALAAELGTAEVGAPVVATVLTSVAAFLPVLMLEGSTGAFLAPLPIVVGACLVFSLVEGFSVLPAHLAHWFPRRGAAPAVGAARPAPHRPWFEPLRAAYVRVLSLALAHRALTLALALASALVVAAIGYARLPFVLFDEFESKLFYVSLRLDPGAALEDSARIAEEVERRVLGLPADELESVHTLLGVAASNAAAYDLAPNLAQVWVELREGGAGRRSTAEVLADVRQRLVGLPPEVQSIELAQPQTNPGGRAIELSVSVDAPASLAAVAAEVRAVLARFDGVRDIGDDLEVGKREVQLCLSEGGRALGLDDTWLAGELRAAFDGREVGDLRRGGDEVAVVVRGGAAVQRAADSLALHRVALRDGSTVPLAAVAESAPRRGPASIAHDEGRVAVTVTADVDEAVTDGAKVIAALARELPELSARFPGLSVRFGGEARETARALAGLGAASLLALALIYVVLGTLFKSYLQPLVVMAIIPFAAVGMVGGHWLMDRPITLMSLIGLLALTGVVVNDALILVDFVNRWRAEGRSVTDALLAAGRQRFRPIVLTSVTTMLGLVPLTFFAAGEARFLQPMAISIFYGLGAATVLVLVIVPVVYAVTCRDSLLAPVSGDGRG